MNEVTKNSLNSRSEMRRVAVQNPDMLIAEIERLRMENSIWRERTDREQRLTEQSRADSTRLRQALESIVSLSHSWVIAEQTIDCKHTYDQIRIKARAALAGES